jgi:hypothetical protein
MTLKDMQQGDCGNSMEMSLKIVFNNFMSGHKSDISRRLFQRILKYMLEFKCGFLKIYAVLELNC